MEQDLLGSAYELFTRLPKSNTIFHRRKDYEIRVSREFANPDRLYRINKPRIFVELTAKTEEILEELKNKYSFKENSSEEQSEEPIAEVA